MHWLSLFVITVEILHASYAQLRQHLTKEQLDSLKAAGVNPEDHDPNTFFLTPATLSDEEEGSKFMPEAHRCDACHVVHFKLDKKFRAGEVKTKGKRLKLYDVVDAVESVCKDDYQNYGIKSVMGVNRLSGEGTETAHHSGVVSAGELWKNRLQNLCLELVGLYEEDEIYAMFRKDESNFQQNLCDEYFCRKTLVKDEF